MASRSPFPPTRFRCAPPTTRSKSSSPRWAPTGSELRSAGRAAHPLLITVRATREATLVTDNGKPLLIANTPPAPKKPLIKQWWLWTAVGVVVVGAALGGGLGYYYSRDTSHVGLTISSSITQSAFSYFCR